MRPFFMFNLAMLVDTLNVTSGSRFDHAAVRDRYL